LKSTEDGSAYGRRKAVSAEKKNGREEGEWIKFKHMKKIDSGIRPTKRERETKVCDGCGNIPGEGSNRNAGGKDRFREVGHTAKIPRFANEKGGLPGVG